jgi:hypothetical protein
MEKCYEQIKKYRDQSHIEGPSLELPNLLRLNGKNIKTPWAASKLDHTMYGRFKILENISPMAIHLHHPKPLMICLVIHIYLIESLLKGNQVIDLNSKLNTSDTIENTPEYEVEKVMGSTRRDIQVLCLIT